MWILTLGSAAGFDLIFVLEAAFVLDAAFDVAVVFDFNPLGTKPFV
ncbi:hypothetical protein ACO0LM_05675 [Undibacterium sp. Di26W]